MERKKQCVFNRTIRLLNVSLQEYTADVAPN